MNVSVCIPTFNQAPYIEEAIRSAVNQTTPPVEIIVSDDCSTDDTRDVLARLEAEIGILRVVRQPVNLGISRNVDACLRMARTELVVRLDSDDSLRPDYIARLAAQMAKHPDAGYAHAAVQEVDKNGNLLNQRRLARASGMQAADAALKAAVKGYRVAANIVMFRKEALDKVGYIAAKVDFAEDYYLSAAIARAGYGNVYLDEILCAYRVWLDSGKVRQRRKIAEIAGVRDVFDEVLQPAFAERHWDGAPLAARRQEFACQHSGSLAWDVYTRDEKQQLAQELFKVSDSRKVRMYSWLYLNGHGGWIGFYNRIVGFPRATARRIYLRLKAR